MSNWYHFPKLSINLDNIEATKLVGVQPSNTHDQVFVDLYLDNGQTIQISLSFNEQQLAEIKALGPKPQTPEDTKRARSRRTPYPGNRIGGWTKKSRDRAEAIMNEYTAREMELRELQTRDWKIGCEWFERLNTLGEKFGNKLYEDLLMNMGIR